VNTLLERVSKNTHISKFMKIRPVGVELLADVQTTGRQTDRQTYRQTGQTDRQDRQDRQTDR